jgi:hypothetical protein
VSSITPTVGRKVWFYEFDIPFGHDMPVGAYSLTVPFDATVIYVWGPNMVNLLVTDHTGKTYPKTSVTLRDPQPDDSHGKSYVCTWMPYQVGAAK